MPGAVASLPPGLVVRKLAFTVVGVFLFAAGLTLLFDGMRAVMEVGGSCASGGPYAISRPCPDGVGLIFVGIFGGLVGVGLVVAGTLRGGPKLYTLAWPALFCALGWNFLQYGIDPPPPNDGPIWGWLVCAVVFLAMGGIPLVLLLANARSVLWGTDPEPIAPDASSAAPFATSGPARRTALPFGTTTVATAPPAPPPAAASREPDEPTGALIADLERLSVLHRDRQLTDDEFARAKAARLAEEDGR